LVSITNSQSPVALRVLLAALDQRQDELCRVAGIKQTTLSHYLAGRRSLSDSELNQLETALLVLRVVDSAPPLSDETIFRIRELVQGAGK
jgi:transcriptional regulator with XRE-family HTH domain